ncbi:CHAP domain-containing protein [Candidatus Saccharibacteria bacterium]|nr:CHAP domain-containing protein [Candidatus Saccharibacteria bacterium]
MPPQDTNTSKTDRSARQGRVAHILASRDAHGRSRLVKFLLIALMALTPIAPVLALDYNTQVESVESEIKSYEQAQVRLGEYANSLQTALIDSNAQLAAVQSQIALNEAQFDALTSELEFREADVAAKSRQVGSVLRANYVDGDVTPLELLASSQNLSAYVDRFEYRDRLRSQLQRDLTRLTRAQKQVEAQRDEVARLLRDGKAMRTTLEVKRKEQEDLLIQTRGQQEMYTQLIAERNRNIAEMRAQQLSANQATFSGGKLIEGDPAKGGYPAHWADAPQDSLVDDWGMYNRECVSYTAWKVHQSGKRMPYWGGRGNANQWPTSARDDGISTGTEPRKGVVAIAMIGPYGHAMYVEEVLDGGKIRISEFNYFVNGTYTERIISPGNLTFIYF